MTSSPSESRVGRKRAWPFLLAGGIVAGGVVALLAASWLWRKDTGPQERAGPAGAVKAPAPSRPPSGRVAERPGSSSSEPPAPADELSEEIAALKKEMFETARRLMADFPNDAAPLLLMGDVHKSFGDSAQATRYWEQCLQRDPNRAEAYRALGEVALTAGQFEKAASLWRKALQVNPKARGVRDLLGRALIDLGRMKEAVAVLEEDVREPPQSSMSHFLLGEAYLQLREYQQAKRCYERAIEIQPSHTQAHYGLATACARLGERDKSQEHRKRFLELKAQDVDDTRSKFRDLCYDAAAVRQRAAEIHAGAAGVYRAAGNLPRAEELLRRAVALDPDSATSWLALAAVYQRGRRYADALRAYERLAQMDPQNARYRMYVGIANAQLGRLDVAHQCFEEVVRLAPERSWGYQGLAQVYLNTNRRLPEAKAHAEKAAALDPVASNYYILSEACRKTGDTAGALAALKRALELDPDNPKYRQKYRSMVQGN